MSAPEPLTKAAILAAHDRAEQALVPVPEWGGSVLVGVISAGDRDRFEQQAAEARKAQGYVPHFRARFCALCLVDSQGQRLFADADLGALSARAGAALDRVFEAGWKLNRMGDEGVREAEKNSGSNPAAASSSGSPDTWAAPSASCSAASTAVN